MGSCCGGVKKATNASGKTYVDPQGKETDFATEVEAKAALVRAGGAGSIK